MEALETSHANYDDSMYFWDSSYKQFVSRHEPVNRFVYAEGCVKIRDLSEYAPLAETTKKAVHGVCSFFAERKNLKPEQLDGIVREVFYGKGVKLSIFGLFHCFNLIEDKQPPCDFETFGFKLEDISRAINLYVRHCKAEYNKHLASLEEKGSLPANFAGLARAMDKAPDHVQRKFQELITNQAKRDEEAKRMDDKYGTFEENMKSLIDKGIVKPANPSANDFD